MTDDSRPMNPASKVWPVLNPNLIHVETGAWAHREGAQRTIEPWTAEEIRDHWRAKWEQDR